MSCYNLVLGLVFFVVSEVFDRLILCFRRTISWERRIKFWSRVSCRKIDRFVYARAEFRSRGFFCFIGFVSLYRCVVIIRFYSRFLFV